MAFRLEHAESVDDGMRRIARERLDDAIARLEGLGGGSPDEIETSVHEVRKHTKELRGLIRLIRPDLGDEYPRANRALRKAAEQLSSIRDAQALLGTFEDLTAADAGAGGQAPELESIRGAQAAKAAKAAKSVDDDDRRVARARKRLTEVRRRAARWDIPGGFEALGPGLERTYRRGRKGLRRARRQPTDDRMHEWRKRVKYLWYQVRLLEATAPSVLAPLVDRLDDLGDALGDDHDLAVLVHGLETEDEHFGGRKQVSAAIELARRRQDDLRDRAFGLGSRLYAENPEAFVERMRTYWMIDRELGEERPTGSIADLSDLHPDRDDAAACTTEREREFLFTNWPG